MLARRFGVIAFVLALPATSLRSSAHACTCVHAGAIPIWPAASAQDVPLNPTVVLQVSDFSELDPLVATNEEAPALAEQAKTSDGGTIAVAPGLYDASGSRLELQEFRRFEFEHPCTKGYSLLSPKGTLEANTDYVLEQRLGAPTAFRTGPSDRALDPDLATLDAFQYHVAGTLTAPTLISKVFVEYHTRVPFFFIVNVTTGRQIIFSDQIGISPGALSIAPHTCADVEIVGLSGASLQRKQFCGPDRCVESVRVQDCWGAELDAFLWEQFQATQETGSCGVLDGSVHDPATAPQTVDGSVHDPATAPQTVDGSVHDSAAVPQVVDDDKRNRGCAVSRRTSAPWLALGLSSMLLVAWRRCRRSSRGL